MADTGEKTEDASPKQLRKARERGEVAQSRDLTSAMLLCVAGLVLGSQAEEGGKQIGDFAKEVFTIAGTADWSSGGQLVFVLASGVLRAGIALLPFLAALMAAAIFVPFFQVGALLTLDPLTPKLSKFDPISGIKKMFFSLQAYIELLKSILKIAVVAIIFYKVIRSELLTVLRFSEQAPDVIARQTMRIAGRGLSQSALFFLGVSVLDYFYQRWQYNKNLKMTREQVKQEHKDQEGNAEAKSQRRHLQQQMATTSMLHRARKASVIVTNPTHIACAIRYDPDSEDAPRLLGKGTGYLAEKLKEIAREEDIPIMRDVTLAHALFKMEEDDQIPEELFDAVAEVLRWVELVMRSQGQTPAWLNTAPKEAPPE